ncbi:CMP-N-acetylneuraminate-beta-galactosamide-alpha-2,3-sialyltransferase 4-like [Mixophyes fleayi]|uniref:CMP-N-acetylneuraminate-beta-galactosamide- alpha-2,3-sialyltransferase 4-like n=1 Tax=Mixophyes fleayi TaxID=3061075 RepID=UPI003F4E0D50
MLCLFYPESARFNLKLDNNPDTLLVLVPFKTQDILWIKTTVKNEKQVKNGFWKKPPLIWDVKPQNIRIQNPYFVNFAATRLLGFNHTTKRNNVAPTTGLIAISFALHFCDQVNIAGFGYPAWSNNTHPIHYYSSETIRTMSEAEHNISKEHLAIRTLLHHTVIHNLTLF